MEGIIAIIIFLVILSIFRSVLGSVFSAGKNVVSSSNINNKFNIIAEKSNEKLSDENPMEFEFIKVYMDGMIKVPYDGYNTNIGITMFDITDGTEVPLICTLDSMQLEKTPIFYYSRDMKMPYKGTVINKFEFMRVPTMFLKFPKSGRRKIKINIEVLGINGGVLKKATEVLYHNVIEKGYLEEIDNMKKFEENIIKTAILVGSIDGYLGYSEEKVVEKWIEKVSFSLDFDRAWEKEERLKRFMEEGKEEVKLGYNIYEYLDNVDDWATEAQKYEIYELCLKVASADGVAAAEELEILKDIAEYLELDHTKYQAMAEKELPITIHEASSITPEEMIGITPNMNKKEIKKHLMSEYRKWNARVGNTDSKIREQAEEMTMLIAELRKKYR